MGQNNTTIDIMKDVLFSDSKERLEDSFIFHIIKMIDIKHENYLQMEICIDNCKCDQFIIKKREINDTIKSITVKLKDIKLKMIKNRNYLEIKDYNVINGNVIINEGLQQFYFELPEVINNISTFDEKKNISVKLKTEEIESISSFDYKLRDFYSQNILIDLSQEYKDILENDKIYLFNGFNYCNYSLKPINISTIEIIDKDSDVEKIILSKDFQTINNEENVNIQGKIKDIYLEKFSVLFEEQNTKNNIEIKLNINLIKKINPNSICTFINFKKRNNMLIPTIFSDIYSEEETFIEIYFYDLEEQYYNTIRINNKCFDINKEKIKFKIDSIDKDEIFEQKFIYEKKKGKNIEHIYEFFLEINKGKTNCFGSFLKKTGSHTYQLYFQSKKEEFLPKSLDVKINENEKIKLNIFDNYENKLLKRMTIINCVEQNFFEEMIVDYNGNKINDNNLKLLILAKNNNFNKNPNDVCKNKISGKEISKDDNKNSIYIFKYNNHNMVEKERFLIKNEEKEKIDNLLKEALEYENENKDNLDSKLLNKLSSLFLNVLLKEYCRKGFNKYIFNNSKYDYEYLKKIIILYIFYEYNDSKKLRSFYIEEIRENLKRMKNAKYLERIQILLFLFNNIENRKCNVNYYFIDIFEESNNSFNIFYNPCIKAFDLFFEILDKQNEECPFFQAILQLNGLIKTDLISGIKMYSGIINSLKDIKFEIIKRLNRFCVIDTSLQTRADGEFFPNCKIIAFYPSGHFEDKDCKIKNIKVKLQTAFLFLIFHEVCGHLKTNINNIELSPVHYLNNDLNIIFTNFKKADSGFIFEHILTNNAIDLKMIIQEEFAEQLFDVKYYIQKDFNDLREKINIISPKILYYPETDKIVNKKKSNSKSEVKSNLKRLPDFLARKLEEAEENLEEYNYHRLFPLFKVPDNMTPTEFDDILKNNRVYKKFMKIISNDAKY